MIEKTGHTPVCVNKDTGTTKGQIKDLPKKGLT